MKESKTMKKVSIFSIIALLFCAAFAFGACGNTGKAPVSEGTAKPAQTVQNGKRQFVLGMSQPNFSDSWRATCNEEMLEAVKKYPEFSLTILNGQRDNNKQISDIESLIEKNVDVIMVSPNEAKPLTAVIKKAYEKGIPVILIDRKIEGEYYTQYIGCDNVLIGRLAGEWASRRLGEEGGNVVEIMGTIGTSAQIERHKGFLEGIAGNPKIRIIDSRPADWMRDKAIVVMEKMLEKHSKIDLVYAHNDFSALGAYTVAKKAGRDKEMAFIGIDALLTPDSGIQGVMDGKLDVTYRYPTGAKEAIESCYRLLVKGEKLPKELNLNTQEITADNVQEIVSMLKR